MADWSPALGRSTGTAAIFAPPSGGVAAGRLLAEGKAADAPGWVEAAAPAATRGAGAPDGGKSWTVEVVALRQA